MPMLVKLPVKQAQDWQRKLEKLRSVLRKRSVVDHDLYRKVTMPNMVRVALAHGSDCLDTMSDDQLLNALAALGLTRGRPRGR